MPEPAPQAAAAQPSLDSGLISFCRIAQYLDRPVDVARLRHELGGTDGNLGETDLLRCAKRLGIKARAIDSRAGRLARLGLPALAAAKDDGWFVIARAGDSKVLIQDAASARPEVLTHEQLATRWSGRLILLTTRETIAGERRPFDWTWFLPAIVRFRRLFGTVLVASVTLQILGLLAPMFTQVVIDKVLVHRAWATLDVLAVGFVAVILFENLLSALRTWLTAHTASRVDIDLAARTYRHLLGLPLAYFQVRRVGQTVARVRELESMRQFLTGPAMTLVIDVLFMVVFLAVMLLYSPALTLIVALAIPVFAAIVLAIAPVLRRRIEEKFNRGAENQAFLFESVAGIETVKSMAVEPQMQNRWEQQTAGSVTASFRVTALANVGNHLIQTVAKLVTAAILWFGAHEVIAGGLTVGQFICFSMLANHAIAPILRMAHIWPDFQQFRISRARLGDVLNTPAEPGWRPGRASLGRIKGKIEFQSVTFRYRADGPEALRRVSFTIQPGEIVGVVGASGSGKSTLAKLIQRLYVPEGGRMLVDGVDLAMPDPAWLRRQIGVVPQENLLFTGSVRDNIALADHASSMERVVAAAKLAGAHDFILQLPEGYDSQVEERGMNLSGGQRQRIAIARALLLDPRILIFDEATSALDAEAEEIIQQNMARIAAGRTVVVIAHRLSALRLCTRIIGLDNGEIVEDGLPATLIKQAGPFGRFVTKQAQAMRPEGIDRGTATRASGGTGLHESAADSDRGITRTQC